MSEVAKPRASLVAAALDPKVHTLDPCGGQLDGFGGMHGGLIGGACLAASMPNEAGWRPVSLTINFLASVRETSSLVSTPIRWSKRTGYSEVSVHSNGADPLVRASAIWAKGTTGSKGDALVLAPPSDVRPFDRCEIFDIPRELVPIAPLFTIRPATNHLPYGSARDARLCAWVTLNDCGSGVGTSLTPEEIVLLADSLAPAISAKFSTYIEVPSVSLSVLFPRQDISTSRTVLIDARANDLGNNWSHETINVWQADGTPLAHATQLRLAKTGSFATTNSEEL